MIIWWLMLIIGFLCFLAGLFLGGLMRIAKDYPLSFWDFPEGKDTEQGKPR